MRHIVVVLIAIVFAIAMHIVKKYRVGILLGGVAVLCLISGVYAYSHAENILPARNPFNQTFYDPAYIETQEFPDAFLKLYLEGKTVYVKDDAVTTSEAWDVGAYWFYGICHYYSIVHYMESVKANVVPDKSMNGLTVTKDKAEKFESMGYLNDLLRNTMMYSGIDDEMGNYFYYQWWYKEATDPVFLYVNPEDLINADELVLIWQPQGDDISSEDMYLMSKEFYEQNIK